MDVTFKVCNFTQFAIRINVNKANGGSLGTCSYLSIVKNIIIADPGSEKKHILPWDTLYVAKKVQSLIAFLSVKYLKLGASLQLLEPSANVHRYQTSFVNKGRSKMTSYKSLAFIKSVFVPFIFCKKNPKIPQFDNLAASKPFTSIATSYWCQVQSVEESTIRSLRKQRK